jgi:hypothetical protein
MCLEAKSQDTLSSRVQLTCLTAYLVSFRRRTAIYLGSPRRLMRWPSRRYNSCEPRDKLFKTFHLMSPPSYGWCETTRSARHDRRPLLYQPSPATSAFGMPNHVLPLSHFGASPTYVTAAWCGPTTMVLAREERRGSTQQYDPKAQHASVGGGCCLKPITDQAPSAFHSRHIGVSKGKLHI